MLLTSCTTLINEPFEDVFVEVLEDVFELLLATGGVPVFDCRMVKIWSSFWTTISCSDMLTPR